MLGYGNSTQTSTQLHHTGGRDAFREGLTSVKDSTARAAIRSRLDRLLLGNFGDHRRLNGDLYELRIHYGPGYRIYCGDLDGETVILLCGGTKRTQKKDIQIRPFRLGGISYPSPGPSPTRRGESSPPSRVGKGAGGFG
ncbi:hypothetical protein HYR99_18460 [Candidatus Poribacteria bacterium]|nr:hypothetical protein [Candidatus Poribacteria bacterium]